MTPLSREWLRDHPLPAHDHDTDKNQRGRVLAVGGGAFVPGALRLTGEAALRAGAGKLQLATVTSVALHLGLSVPEAAVISLEAGADGEIECAAAAEILKKNVRACDTLILGPGMSVSDACSSLVIALLDGVGDAASAVLDAAAIHACAECGEAVRGLGGRAVLTPHAGEMAALSGRDADWIADNMEAIAADTAAKLQAVIVLKGAQTVIAAPSGETLAYAGGGPELATGGSGDVLAGIVGGLLSRQAEPLVAAAWAVWVHGGAGAAVTAQLGGPGLLARELLPRIPELLHAPATR